MGPQARRPTGGRPAGRPAGSGRRPNSDRFDRAGRSTADVHHRGADDALRARARGDVSPRSRRAAAQDSAADRAVDEVSGVCGLLARFAAGGAARGLFGRLSRRGGADPAAQDRPWSRGRRGRRGAADPGQRRPHRPAVRRSRSWIERGAGRSAPPQGTHHRCAESSERHRRPVHGNRRRGLTPVRRARRGRDRERAPVRARAGVHHYPRDAVGHRARVRRDSEPRGAAHADRQSHAPRH